MSVACCFLSGRTEYIRIYHCCRASCTCAFGSQSLVSISTTLVGLNRALKRSIYGHEGGRPITKEISALPALTSSGISVVALMEIPRTYIKPEWILRRRCIPQAFARIRGLSRLVWERRTDSKALFPLALSPVLARSGHDCFCFISADVPEIMPRAAMGGSLPSSRRLS
ncbi:hypothetical protein BJ912DRAFT_175918 [Pholiota molesta]|nr:hypothetical protein BJ912DRAFT_175918 [Pholiota molesta]